MPSPDINNLQTYDAVHGQNPATSQLIEFCPSTVSAKQGKQRKILNKKDRYTSLIGGFAAHGHIQLAQEILKNRRVGCFVYRLSWQHIPRKRCWANLAVLCVCVQKQLESICVSPPFAQQQKSTTITFVERG